MVVTTRIDGTKLNFDVELLNQIEQNLNEKVICNLQKNKHLCNAVESSGASLLHYAVDYDNDVIAKYLINFGSKVNLQNKDGNTPLLLATKKKHVALIKVLLDYHAAIYICDNKGISALQVAVHTIPIDDDVLKYFLREVTSRASSNGVIIAQKLIEVNCPLYLVANYTKNPQALKIMIDKGFSIKTKHPISGKIALHFAVENLDSQSVHVLVSSGANVNAKDISGKTPIAVLNDFSKSKVVLRILETLTPNASLTSCDNDGFMQIRSILQNGPSDAVELVLKVFNHNLAVTDTNNRNLVHYLALNCNFSPIIYEYEEKQKLKVLKNYLNAQDEDGLTALHYAMSSGNKRFGEFLIKNGANMSIDDDNGFSPFLHAVSSNLKDNLKKRVECVNMLLKKKCHPEIMLKQYFKIYDAKSSINKDFVFLEPVIAMLVFCQNSLDQDIHLIFDTHMEIKKYFDVCTMELENMKNEKIFREMSLFDIFVWDDNTRFSKFRIHFEIRSWQLRKRNQKYESIVIYREILEDRARSINITEVCFIISICMPILLSLTIYTTIYAETAAKKFLWFGGIFVFAVLLSVLIGFVWHEVDTNESCRNLDCKV